MRTFDVTVNGAHFIIRANDFLRPSETTNNKWAFTNATGKVLWSYSAESVTAVIEGVQLVAA